MLNEKYCALLNKAKKHIEIAEYFLDTTMEITEDGRMMSKSLIELQKATTIIIELSLILYDISSKSKEHEADIFFKKVGFKLFNKNEISELKKILIFTKEHKKSHLEFVKKDKFVIFGHKECKILTKNSLKKSILIVKGVIYKISKKRKI